MFDVKVESIAPTVASLGIVFSTLVSPIRDTTRSLSRDYRGVKAVIMSSLYGERLDEDGQMKF